MNRLLGMGLSQPLLAQLDWRELESGRLGRVVFESRQLCRVLTEDEEVLAGVHPLRATRGERVVVGDWVVLDRGQDPPWVARRLERRSELSRRDPGGGVQVLCANVDRLLVVSALGRDLNARRWERYRVLAVEAGLPVSLILTKIDEDPASLPAAMELARRHFEEVWPVCAPRGEGLEAVRAAVPPGATAALLGSSGVGKTTLVNALTGAEAATGPVREEDQRGRHTTTARSLLALPGGGWLVDNPGLRQVGLADPSAVVAAFTDIDTLAERCRFRDCAHAGEPDCAVAAAVESGLLDPDRWASFEKLRREAHYEERRLDRRATQRARAAQKVIQRALRQKAERRDRSADGGSG